MWARSHVTRANREGGAVRDPAGRGLGGRPEGVRVVPRLGPQPLWWGKLESRVGPQRAMKVLLLTALGALFFTYYWDDNFDPASLQGARVLLTGASAGVGEELAYHYARLGSHLVLTAYTEALLQKVVGNCRKLGAPKVFYIAADMASPEAPEHVVQFALDKLGGLDYLVLNHVGGAPAGTRGRSAQATRGLLQAPPRAAPAPGDSRPPPAGELAELRAADLAGAAEPDGQQGLPGGGVLAARCVRCLAPRAACPRPSPRPTRRPSSRWTASSAPCGASWTCRTWTWPSPCACWASGTAPPPPRASGASRGPRRPRGPGRPWR
ncbi:hydroxysteroid 11-beta-dehydrogenase 1-like protein isoform X5 [Microcebus murinus]|uniref:hydroxysteroid 11-beta-dehydrogenase 1-like protein isoform X5 n=1 Tax=Microcebus murinus TaxID=30608 RepID=UPI003F6B8246